MKELLRIERQLGQAKGLLNGIIRVDTNQAPNACIDHIIAQLDQLLGCPVPDMP